jgi:hypothetical protein
VVPAVVFVVGCKTPLHYVIARYEAIAHPKSGSASFAIAGTYPMTDLAQEVSW